MSIGESIEATPGHPFYVQDKGFPPAKVLAAGMILATLSQSVTVEAVTPVEKSATVYNFAVDKTHTYFVGKSSVWVHNDCVLRVNLRVILTSVQHRADVTLFHNRMTADEVAQLNKISSYTGRKVFGERVPFTPGFDGWLDEANTGLKISLKGTAMSNPENVVSELVNARRLALRANLQGERVAVYIDAPNVEANSLLLRLSERGTDSPLNLIPGSNDARTRGAIGDVTVFCRGGATVHFDAP